MATAARARPEPAETSLRFGGATYGRQPGETVLDALLRHGVEIPYSCRKGTCLICTVKCVSGNPTPAAQEPLPETLRTQGFVLACQFAPEGDAEIAPADDQAMFAPAEIIANDPMGPTVRRLRLRPLSPFDYRPGQFLNLKIPLGTTRSYSLASEPSCDRYLELHIRHRENGALSGWVFEKAAPGDRVEIAGPFGHSFYVPGKPEQPMLMVATGTGLAPLIGILRDALRCGHTGPIRIYHGSRQREGLYLDSALKEVAKRRTGLSYSACVSGSEPTNDVRRGRADQLAFGDLKSLNGWRVFLSGNPAMVHAAKKTAYLAGARLEDIHADPFELRDLRRWPRD
ncbi:MAG: 2Fe-2S iron-sulfur cluster-binding protein [Alphaproteobacteria bacterium]